MKIGIITLPPSFNYGNILQAWALQTVLERMGHRVDIVVARPRRYKLPPSKKLFVYVKRFLLKYFWGNKNIILHYEERLPELLRHTERFIQQHLHIHEYYSFANIGEKDYEAYVVGSDQIWRRRYNSDIRNCYLFFTEGWGVKRIAYAASFGTSNWEYSPEETKDCAELLSRFDGISVREADAVRLVKEKFHLKAHHVLDPTLLLNREEYEQLILNSSTPHSAGDMLCYLLSDEPQYNNIIEEIASDRGLTPFKVYSRFDDQSVPMRERIQLPVETWLRGFYDAKLVITDSFHATVFSIIFQKPFILFGSGIRGNERMESLLKMVGFDITNGITNKIFTPTSIHMEVIYIHRQDALDFLINHLN